MPANHADVAAGVRAAQIESVADGTIKARYPNARDGSKEPAEGFFDSAADAEAALSARQALLGVERRRFAVGVQDLIWPDPKSGMITVTLRDPEQDVEGPFLVSRMELSLEDETTSFEVFG